jgi:hypothetical protein
MPDASRSRFAFLAHLGLQYCFQERERRNLVLQIGQALNSAGFLGINSRRQILIRLKREPFMGGFACNLAKAFRNLPSQTAVASNEVIEVRLGNTEIAREVARSAKCFV